MNTGNGAHRRLTALLLTVAIVAGVRVALPHDRVNEICVYGGKISYCVLYDR